MLVYEDLRNSGNVPRVHGNGFIQLDLNDSGTRRLHVWHEDIPRQTISTPIHDHVFDIRSSVILGTLIHEELEPINIYDGVGTHKIYRAQHEKETQNTILVPDEGTVVLETVQKLYLAPGSLYTFPTLKLHQTDHVGLTATIMDKTYVSTPSRPRVLVPVGQEPDNEFRRDEFDPEELWPYIQRALKGQ